MKRGKFFSKDIRMLIRWLLAVCKKKLSVTKIAGEYNLLIIFLNQDDTEEDE
jgi:hypothetical protein